MKSIAPAAMAAIVAGEAIVTGAVEIYSVGTAAPVLGLPSSADLTWWQVSAYQIDEGATTNDSARMGMAFFDASAEQIGATIWAALDNNTDDWNERTLTADIPSNTVTLRVYQHRHRNFGSYIDGYIDDISLTLDGAAVALVNPGAELETVGWTNDASGDGRLVWTDGFGINPRTPHGGSKFFSGDAIGNDAIAYQDVGPFGTSIEGEATRLWGGYGPITLDGQPYKGIGDRGFAQQTGGAVGGVAQGLTLGVSGVEAVALELLDPAEVKRASIVVRRLIFASDGKTLLDYDVWDRGRGDALSGDRIVGGTASISLSMESAARGLGRAGSRMRSDADQRLFAPNDGYYKDTAYAGSKKLYWGGKKPAIGLHG